MEKPWYEFFNEERPYDEIVNFINQYIVEDHMASAKKGEKIDNPKFAFEIEPAKIFDLIKQEFQDHLYSDLTKENMKNVQIKLCSHVVLKATMKDRFLKNLKMFKSQNITEPQVILISFSNGEFIADFTATDIYWKKLQKNLAKVMLGLQNYKLP